MSDPLLSDLPKRTQNIHELRALLFWLRIALARKGDVAECGVRDGSSALHMARVMAQCAPDRTIHLFDAWEHYTSTAKEFPGDQHDRKLVDTGRTDGTHWGQARSSDVSALFTKEVPALRHEMHPGWFADTLPAFDRPLCFVSVDADLYESTRDAITMLDRLLVPGGVAVFHDDHKRAWAGVEYAITKHLDGKRYTVVEPRTVGACQSVGIRKWE